MKNSLAYCRRNGNTALWIIYIGNVISAKTSATATEYVLTLATLGDAIKNRNNPIFCHTAQEQWLLSLVAVAGIIALDFANVNTALVMKEKRVIVSSSIMTPLTHKFNAGRPGTIDIKLVVFVADDKLECLSLTSL